MNIAISIDKTRYQDDGFAKVKLRVPDLNEERQLDINFREFYRYCGLPKTKALDFLFIACVCYLIDKLIPRSETDDLWTRELEVSIPVSDPATWEPIKNLLNDTLSFLTGDLWSVAFEAANQPLFRLPLRQHRTQLFSEFVRTGLVCLSSGGLDSLAGTIDLLETYPDQRVLLVGHYDAPTGEQETVFSGIRPAYPDRVKLMRMRVRLDPPASPETTLRSRSLLFLALGLCAAQSFGPDVPLFACENGLIALNVPITPSRAGSCSTRTMHPLFLSNLRQIIQQAGITNPLENPFEFQTKGECLAGCKNQSLLQSQANTSVSCAHAHRRQNWIRKHANNCGYCVPCLIRRAALYHIGADDGLKYGIDVVAGELDLASDIDAVNDILAILDLLRSKKTAKEFAKEILEVALLDRITDRAAMVERGVEDLRSLIRGKGMSRIKQ